MDPDHPPDDELRPSTGTHQKTVVATGAAAAALVAGTILLFVLFGVVLVKFGFGVLLLAAAAGLLLFGAVYDLRRKRRRPPDSF
jgi:hypothetical protein